ncbi:hypothetical protein JI664_01260 [Rhodobacter sp. NTK016B]|uniref:hypothetical protein n=1 Tax=Rhodobacter sp. NTK016B TaxID=2759676 RepID=UPI001A9084AA|nr:hypothetical protein [Rhodobacter sp. NTK016B]MBN8290582.1 hypothetical protein [Rhodobacter sp. NTK016B]
MHHPTQDHARPETDTSRTTGMAAAGGLSWREFFVRLGNGTLPAHSGAGNKDMQRGDLEPVR